METVGIRDLRDNLSRIIKRVEEGEVIRVLRHGRDVVELHPVKENEGAELLNRLKARCLHGGRKGILGKIKTVKNRRPHMPVSDMVLEDRR